MVAMERSLEEMTFTLQQDIHVAAPLETTFAALLEQLGPGNETPEGVSLDLVIEAWPGGRWYRDLGDSNGHLWAHVQAIKRPTLLEFVGPIFASFPLLNNVQYRLSEAEGGTVIRFKHTALGLLKEEHKTQMPNGWNSMHERVKKAAEAAVA